MELSNIVAPTPVVKPEPDFLSYRGSEDNQPGQEWLSFLFAV
jgi:hypothetical protein